MSGLDAIILAGGRARRLDGASKPDLVVGGRRLLETAIQAARSVGCREVVVVGPPTLDAPGCLVVREDPPFGGPVAGLTTGFAALAALAPSTDVLVLACDMPDAEAAAQRLTAARGANPRSDAVCLVDDTGREQWLAAIYSHHALARAFEALGGDVDGASMRRLAASVDLVTVAGGDTTHDIDTWDDLAHATRQEEHDMSDTQQSPETLDRWLAALATELGVDPASVPVGAVLDLARDVAHGVARPAAPLSTFVVGLAVGAGTGSLEELSARASALADGWSSDETA